MSILPDSRYEKIHTGSEIEVQRLHSILEENNIPSIIRNDNESAKLAGYALASPDYSRLLVDKDYVVKAKHLVSSALDDFAENEISDSELDNLARQTPVHEKVISKNAKLKAKAPQPSKALLVFYFAYLVYAWVRLYPVIFGSQEIGLRTYITAGLSIFCVIRLISWFSNKPKAV